MRRFQFAGGEKSPACPNLWNQSGYHSVRITMSVHSFRSAPILGANRSRSPPPHRRVSQSSDPRRGCCGGMIVKRIIKETGQVRYPMLTSTNHQNWALLMKVDMEAAEIWQASRLTKVSRWSTEMTSWPWRPSCVRPLQRCIARSLASAPRDQPRRQ